MEQDTGVEPAFTAWEAVVLPIYESCACEGIIAEGYGKFKYFLSPGRNHSPTRHSLVPGDDMNKPTWKEYAFWIGLSEAVGLLSGWLTREGTQIYADMLQKPPLSPPGWVFGVVWTVLYALMGISATGIYAAPPSRARSRGLNLFVAQLIVNFFWSPIFFNAQAYGFAFVWLLLLWVLVLLMILQFRKVDKPAAWLQIPYFAWLTFAAYLNYAVWQLNR